MRARRVQGRRVMPRRVGQGGAPKGGAPKGGLSGGGRSGRGRSGRGRSGGGRSGGRWGERTKHNTQQHTTTHNNTQQHTTTHTTTTHTTHTTQNTRKTHNNTHTHTSTHTDVVFCPEFGFLICPNVVFFVPRVCFFLSRLSFFILSRMSVFFCPGAFFLSRYRTGQPSQSGGCHAGHTVMWAVERLSHPLLDVFRAHCGALKQHLVLEDAKTRRRTSSSQAPMAAQQVQVLNIVQRQDHGGHGGALRASSQCRLRPLSGTGGVATNDPVEIACARSGARSSVAGLGFSKGQRSNPHWLWLSTVHQRKIVAQVPLAAGALVVCRVDDVARSISKDS